MMDGFIRYPSIAMHAVSIAHFGWRSISPQCMPGPIIDRDSFFHLVAVDLFGLSTEGIVPGIDLTRVNVVWRSMGLRESLESMMFW
jgi:hypothetical protein